MKKTLKRLLACAMCAITLFLVPGTSAYAHTVNVSNNLYYDEVRTMALALYKNVPDEMVRTIGADSMMTSVFGEHYKDWKYKSYDLIGTMKKKELDQLNHALISAMEPIAFAYFEGKSPDSNVHVIVREKVQLGNNGISEKNYEELKLLYSTAETLKKNTLNKTDKEKCRILHDYIADKMTYSVTGDAKEHRASSSLANGKGACEAYATLMYLFGNYCGLETDVYSYRREDGVLHAVNTVLVDGTVRYMDISTDDYLKTDYFFLQTEQEFEASK